MSVDATKTSCLPRPVAAAEAVTLRRAVAEDAAALALVGGATFLEAYTWMLAGRDIVAFCAAQQTAAAYAKYLAEPRTRITMVVAGEDVPVGFAMLTAPELPSFEVQDGDVELKRLYLFSRFRSAATPVVNAPGVRAGQALMDAALADARAMDAKRVLLGTHDVNERAIAFYRRNGFSEAGHRDFQVGSRKCCDLIFAKAL